MQNTESHPSHDLHPTSSCSSSFSSGYGSRSGPSCFSTTYDAVVGAAGPVSGKILFTASQWQELERQTLIYKYIMASIPVPHQLLIPITTKTPPVSQSNIIKSSGSDPEPWRCRRTDGKKWRCSRDVAPEQKYCERHAHKTRTRSRKSVENQNQTNKAANNCTNRPPILPAFTTTDPFQKPISHFQTQASATSFDQARCIEWFMKGGTSNTLPLSTTNQQDHHQSSSSSRIGFKRDITDHTFFHQYEEEQTPFDPYINGQDSSRFESHQLTNCSLLNLNTGNATHTTRRFIDAWSSAEREDLNSIGNKCSVSSARKLPLSSLTLSMSGADGAHEDSVEMEREKAFLKSHWLNPAMWMGSPPPGGPLGEALCLGTASTVNVPSPHGYSNSNSTSSCSKSSCEDAGQGLNFH